jgi:methionyl aminopeptidase
MIFLKSKEEFEILNQAGQILKNILSEIALKVKPGINTYSLEQIAEKKLLYYKVESAFKGYRVYPNILCTSINEEVVHGIPSVKRILKEGDIISIDCGIKYNGFFADMAFTVPVGRIDKTKQELIDCTKKSLKIAIKNALAGNRLGDISYAIQKYVETHGFSVVRDYVGHGIGVNLHEEPEVPNFGYPGQGVLLESGMVICIEPMVNSGSYEVVTKSDKWTVVTKDGKPSAHFEHMVGITSGEPIIFTE